RGRGELQRGAGRHGRPQGFVCRGHGASKRYRRSRKSVTRVRTKKQRRLNGRRRRHTSGSSSGLRAMMMRRLHFTLALGALFLYSSATALSRKPGTIAPPTAPSATSPPPTPVASSSIVEAPRTAEPSPAPPAQPPAPRKRRGGMDVT